MNINCTVDTGMMTIGRRTAASLCSVWLVMAMAGCGLADNTDLVEEQAEVTVGEGSVLADGEGENVAEATEALSSLGFSTFLGGAGYEDSVKPAVDSAGNVYVAGSMPVAGKDRDIFVAKYSPLGSLLSMVTFGGTGAEHVRDLAVDGTGNAYVLAKTASYGSTKTILVAKLNAAGNALSYYSRFGGSGDEWPQGIAVDSGGNSYVTGDTKSVDFPTTPGVFQSVLRGEQDVFVTKLNATGTALSYSTYLGGDGGDGPGDIAVDSLGYAYVVGNSIPPSNGSGFPTTPGAFRTSSGGASAFDAFVTVLTPNGSSLYYSTYLGGTNFNMATGIAVDASFCAYVTGLTNSPNFPTTPGAFRTYKNTDLDTFVLKLNEPGNALLYSTYVGSGGVYSSQIALGSGGRAVVAGTTYVANFPTTANAFQKQFAGAVDGFLMELNALGSAASYATYLGGTVKDAALGVAVDVNGNAYVAGTTDSTNFPVSGAAQPSPGGNGDGFLVKLKGP